MTNPRELVERLKITAFQLAGFKGDDTLSADTVGDQLMEAAAEITRLRDFITALEDGNMTFLCDQLDRAKEENTRLRGLLEEAKRAAERIAKQSAWKTIEAPYSLRTKLDQAQDAASSLLKRLEDATSTTSGQ